jgi:hypothetical protein
LRARVATPFPWTHSLSTPDGASCVPVSGRETREESGAANKALAVMLMRRQDALLVWHGILE